LETRGVTIFLRNLDKVDLNDILIVIGKVGRASVWLASSVECLGNSAEILHKISDEKEKIAGEEFYKIASNVYQVLEGCFEAFNEDNPKPWLIIRSIRGDEFDIETRNKELLEKIRNSFKDVKDLVY
jgi:hypothetical protein